MLSLPPNVHVFIAKAPVDMRKSFDGLENLVRVVLQKNPMLGHLFVFTNKRRNRVKILMWDRHGWSILYKRLEVGTYKFPETSSIADGEKLQVEAAELALMLEGIDLDGAKRRKRWLPRAPNSPTAATLPAPQTHPIIDPNCAPTRCLL